MATPVLESHPQPSTSPSAQVVRIHMQPSAEEAAEDQSPVLETLLLDSSSSRARLRSQPSAAHAVEEKSEDILLSFCNLSVRTHEEGATVVKGLTGYVLKGGMLAIIGASGSGKTVLMEALCGRSDLDLEVEGTVSLNGQIVDPKDSNNMGFVPQEDMLIGELTVRETLMMSAKLRLDAPVETLEKQVSALIHGLGLDHVADNVIGTILKRGLSGGEKRRVSVGVELAARPSVICLDEPTSGLDASSAYVVMRSIRDLARESQGQLCVVASLHQPNSRLLDLFDHLLVLGRSSMLFFGRPNQAREYFGQIGFPCDPDSHVTSTDFIIHLADQRFRQANKLLEQGKTSGKCLDESHLSKEELNSVSMDDRAFHFDFPQAYHQSNVGQRAAALVEAAEQSSKGVARVKPPQFKTSWLNQVKVLLQRSAMVASRDLTLYVLQFILCSFYGFMVGAEFYMLPTRIGNRQNDYTNGIVWLVFVATYLQVFKVYFLMTWKARFHHEHANQAFSTSAWSVANFLSTAFFSFITFIPGMVVGYFMMGMPAESIGYVIYTLFLVGLTAESTMDMLCQFIDYVPSAILMGQGTLVVLCVFAGGAFIRWSKLNFWVWLSEMSLYTWSTRGMLVRIFKHVNYDCPLGEFPSAMTGYCTSNGLDYPCNNAYDPANGQCSIEGSTVLQLYKGVSESNEWYQVGILLLIMGLLRIFTYFLLRFPVLTNPLLMLRLLRGNKQFSNGASNSLPREPVSPIACSLANQQQEMEMVDAAAHNVIHVNSAQSPAHIKAIVHAKSFTSTGCSLRWTDLQLKLRNGDKILVDNLQGEAAPGRVLAIMGPSGAGKTTLLNALSGRAPYAKITGNVHLGSSPLTKSHLDYVPQFDVLNPIFTVYQSFCIMAKLKTRMTQPECFKRVSEVLEILGLTSKARQQVGTLSSGDRKRVSIGLGLISNPSVLFCDEPTTGLDSEAALVVVEYLIRVARTTGVVCIMTIHQPSSTIFSMLDDLLLLTKGVTAYFGPAKNAQPYFDSQGFKVPAETNPADYYLDLMTGDATAPIEADGSKPLPTDSASWKARFLSLSNQYAYVPDGSKNECLPVDPQMRRPSEWDRFLLLIRARMVYFWQERAIYWLRLLEMVLLSIFIGTLFLRTSLNLTNMNEIAGSMFFSIWTVLFAAIAATPIFVRDRITAENEFLNGAFEMGTHVSSLLVAALPYHLVTALIYQSIVWFMVGFNDSFEPWLFSVLSTFSLLVMMEGVSLIVVEFLQNAMLATTGTMVMLGMMFLFPGFFIKVKDMVPAVAWLSWIVPTKYSLDSQLDNILHGQYYQTGVGMPPMTGHDVGTELFKLDHRLKWGDWAIVMSYALFFRFMHYVVLRIRYRAFSKGKMAEEN